MQFQVPTLLRVQGENVTASLIVHTAISQIENYYISKEALSQSQVAWSKILSICYNNHGVCISKLALHYITVSHAGAIAYSFARFGRGNGSIFLDNLYCRGTESRLVDCPHSGIGVHNCDHSADASLRCQGTWDHLCNMMNDMGGTWECMVQ